MGCLAATDASDQSRVNQDEKNLAAVLVTRDQVRTYLKKLEAGIAHCKSTAKTLLRQRKKEKALLALKKGRYQKTLLTQAQSQLFELEQLIANTESAAVQANMVTSLQKGTELLKKLNSQLTIDDVERLLAENDDAIAYSREVGELLSGAHISLDDDELLMEIEESQQAEADSVSLNLPNAPTGSLPTQQAKTEGPVQQTTQQERPVVILES